MDALAPIDTLLANESLSDMLVETVASRLARFVRPFQLRREIEEIISNLRGKPTKLNQESFDKLLGQAQQFLVIRSGERLQTMALKQIGFLQDVIADDDIDVRVQLAANAQLTDLVGTSAKTRSEMYESESVPQLIRQMVGEMENLVEEKEAMLV